MTTIGYDGYGNLLTKSVTSHPQITYSFDPGRMHDRRGWMTTLTDQNSVTTGFAYYERGQIKSIIDPLNTSTDNRTTAFTYYDDGSLWTKKDRNGTTITYTYTPSGKVDTISYSDQSTSVTFGYDDLDNLKTMTDSLGDTPGTGYIFDAANRIQTVTNPYNFPVSYYYYPAGNIKTLTYPGGGTVSYTYDGLNRLKTVKIDWLGQTATYNYKDVPTDLDDNVVHFNGVTTTYTYDDANRLKNVNVNTSTPITYDLTLDANGNRTDITEGGTLTPSLTKATTDYTYLTDAAHNYHKNRLKEEINEEDATTKSFQYDKEGQIKNAGASVYGFDYEHRLKTISNSTEFFYDGAGNRLKVVRGGVATYYIYDAAGNLLAESDEPAVVTINGDGTKKITCHITRYYIYGKGLLAMVIPGTPPAQDQVYTYHFNPVGSTVAVTDQTQAIVNKYAYEPYGEVMSNKVETISQPFKFVGQFGVMAEDNGLYYMRARYYDPKIGRFVSEDPTGFEGGDVNLYAYVFNNPLLLIDPTGQVAWPTDYTTITSPFGANRGGGKIHTGLDIRNPMGGNVYASDSGMVMGVYSDSNGGNQIRILHENGSVSGYAHTGAIVFPFQGVQEGQLIGFSDDSGAGAPHLHYTYRDCLTCPKVDPILHLSEALVCKPK